MSTYEYAQTVRVQLKGLPWRRSMHWLKQLLYWLWEPVYRQLAWFAAGKRGIRGDMWLMIHISEWQQSSLVSALMWLIATPVVIQLVGRLGYGWEINLAVSLAFDAAAWGIHKCWIFDQREVKPAASYGRNLAFWLLFFVINITLSILVFHKLGGSTLFRRGVLGAYGLAINPVMFKIRDRIIFAEFEQLEAIAAWRRLEACKAAAETWLVQIKTIRV